MNIVQKCCVVFLMFTVSACGGGFSGEYRALQGAVTLDFYEDGRVRQSIVGNQLAEFEFEKDGDEVKIYVAPGLAQIYRLQSDDVLIGPGGITLVKQR